MALVHPTSELVGPAFLKQLAACLMTAHGETGRPDEAKQAINFDASHLP